MSTLTSIPSKGEPALLPPRDVPYRLREIYELVTDGSREEIILALDNGHLVISADEDTDEISVYYQEADFRPPPAYRSLGSVWPWDRYVGKECGWTWIAINQQGYCDGALLSFEGIIPSILLHVIASSIEVFTISPVETPKL